MRAWIVAFFIKSAVKCQKKVTFWSVPCDPFNALVTSFVNLPYLHDVTAYYCLFALPLTPNLTLLKLMCRSQHIRADFSAACAGGKAWQRHACWLNRCFYRHMMSWQSSGDASQPNLLKLECWKCHILRKRGNARWNNRSPPHPHEPTHPSHKKAQIKQRFTAAPPLTRRLTALRVLWQPPASPLQEFDC